MSAAHQFLHNVSPVIELMRDYSIPSITDRQFKTYGDAPITVKYFTPDGEEAFEGTYSDPDLRRILLNKEYENMSESDRRALWADIAMHLYHRPEFKIIKGEETMAPHEALDSLSFSPYLENPVHRNYIPIEVIDQSIEDVSNNLIHGAKSNKTNIFTVTPQDYDKIMRSDLPMWRKAVGAVDYGVGQFTKQ